MPKKDVFKTKTADVVHTAVKAVISAVPLAGGPMAEFFALVVAEPSQKRRDEFCQDLYERLIELAAHNDAAKPEALASNPAFQAACVESVQIAARSADQEKLGMLRNAVLNTALATTIEEPIRAMFMQCIERLTVDHVRILAIFDDPLAIEAVQTKIKGIMAGGAMIVVEAAAPDLAKRPEWLSLIIRDLTTSSLLGDPNLNTMMTPSGIGARRTTNLGRDFLNFLRDPISGELPQKR
jgi:hypothetical protein